MTTVKGFKKSNLVTSISPDRFHLILFPTEECNFRCVYCYEDFAVGNMPPWLVDAVKALIKNKIENLKVFNLSWFGGEPLVAKKTVLELSEYAYQLAQENDCKLVGEMTTNGFLLDVKTLTKLVALKQRSFQISIDGDQKEHDLTRVTKNGRGSFDKIWQRLVDASNTDLDFNIMLRIHLTALNIESVKQFCKRYEQVLANDGRFNLFFKAIENLGGDNQEQLSKLKPGELRELAHELQQKYAPVDTNFNYICYASKPNSLAVRANGNLNKCTVALQEDVNNIGKINPDGSIEVNNKKFSTWINGFSTLDSWQMSCPHSYIQAQANKPKFESDIDIVQVA